MSRLRLRPRPLGLLARVRTIRVLRSGELGRVSCKRAAFETNQLPTTPFDGFRFIMHEFSSWKFRSPIAVLIKFYITSTFPTIQRTRKICTRMILIMNDKELREYISFFPASSSSIANQTSRRVFGEKQSTMDGGGSRSQRTGIGLLQVRIRGYYWL